MKKIIFLYLFVTLSLPAQAMYEGYEPEPVEEHNPEQGYQNPEDELAKSQAEYQKQQAEEYQAQYYKTHGTQSSAPAQTTHAQGPESEPTPASEPKETPLTYKPVPESKPIPTKTNPYQAPEQHVSPKPEEYDVNSIVQEGIKAMDGLLNDFNNQLKSIAQEQNTQSRAAQENQATTQGVQKVDDAISAQVEQAKPEDQQSVLAQIFTWLSAKSQKLFNAWRKFNEDALSSLKDTIQNLKDTINRTSPDDIQLRKLKDDLAKAQTDEEHKSIEQEIADKNFLKDYKPKLTNPDTKATVDKLGLDQSKSQLSKMQKFLKFTKQDDLLASRGQVASAIGDLMGKNKGLQTRMDDLKVNNKAYKDAYHTEYSDDYNDLNYYSLQTQDILSSYQDLQQQLNEAIVNQFEAKAQNIIKQINNSMGNEQKLANSSVQIAQWGADASFITESKSYDYLIGDWQKSIADKLKPSKDSNTKDSIYNKYYSKVIYDANGKPIDQTAANILVHLYDILYQYTGIKVNENSTYQEFEKAGKGITQWRGKNPTNPDADVLRELEMYTHPPYVELYKAYKKGIDTFNSLIFDEADRNKIVELNINLNEQMNKAHGFA